ncbi:putative Histidine kinase, HAMP region:Bacterial chemotaxis sensory transducer [Candidatus Terasakiella magnetica]|uniref:Putative Histidine kinase, HAMP region:Bacterial chemotaxis sensory transducer n=1 Tax=Candidatus Terasakiella magnetica TaxID=1867952 RepID=A0A1C3RFG6_9PROT|nr:methyl-accepting chemotaxis protein [Candidatus Terasakiella magnetica]SCA55995.1 putative Histidine kinase, HAMP region:Bacterial chemotaxis sensory transducer [Candidatus Terasakiella magnetica]
MLAKLIDFPNPAASSQSNDTLSAILRLLNRVSNIADEKTDASIAIERIFREVCDYSGWPIAHLYIQNPDDGPEYISHKIWHLDKSLNQNSIKEFQHLSEETVFKVGKGLIGQIAQSLQAQAVEDVTVLKAFLRSEIAKKNNVRGFFGFPIILDNKCVAVAEFYGREVGLLDETSLEIMTYVSSQLARIFERMISETYKTQLMEKFKSSVQGSVEDLSSTSVELSEAATSLNRQCNSSLENCQRVVGGSNEISESNLALETAINTLVHAENESERKNTHVIQTVSDLANDIRSAMSQLTTLNKTAENIGSIIRDVNEIAGQVRMLGLNASIEAARAGVAGKGFAIVAGEIKSLASQSEDASHHISEQINNIQNTLKDSTSLMMTVDSQMNQLETTSQDMTHVLKNQHEATQSIASHVEHSTVTADNISKDVKAMNTAMDELSYLSNNLRTLSSGLEGTAKNVAGSSTEFLDIMQK